MFSFVCDKEDYILVPTEKEYVMLRKTDINEIMFTTQLANTFFTVTVISTDNVVYSYNVSILHYRSMLRDCDYFIKGIGSILNG